jgi:hypothetical protein
MLQDFAGSTQRRGTTAHGRELPLAVRLAAQRLPDEPLRRQTDICMMSL